MRPPSEESVAAGLGERKLVTMLFADLSGYTSLAESMDAEDVYALVRPTMVDLQRVVESFGGTVPQIQGDGFMAVFGVPRAHEDDAERAVRAALAVRDHVRARNRDREGPPVPEVHAGVHSGEVMVAPSGEPAGFAVIGDTVNTASRIAGLASAGRVLVSEGTHRLTEGSIRYGPPRRRRAKGKAQPVLTYEALAAAPHAPRPQAGSFVDREEMLALLGRELESAERSGRSRVVVVTGEPGIGKTRLASELGHSLPEGRFLVGRCAPFGERPPLSALAEAVAGALGVVGAPPEVAREAIDRAARRIAPTRRAAALTADLRSLLAVEGEVPARSERDAARAARLVIGDVASDGPTAVVLDDLHWADPSLRELLAEVHRDPWPVPVLILGLSREPLPGVPAAPLTGLDDASMRSLAERLLGDPVSAGAVGLPIARANGNALFLEELMGMLVETGAIRHERGRWRLGDREILDDVPATIRLVIAARLDALPPDRKRLLHDAAVCGPTTWDVLLERMGGGADPRPALQDLVRRDVLRERPSSSVAGAREYEWRHTLIRDVAYEAIPKAARAKGHLLVAGWLRETSRRGREPIGAIASHYERAWVLGGRRAGDEVAVLTAEYLTRQAEQMYWRQARAAEPLFSRAVAAAEAAGDPPDPRPIARAAAGLAEVLIEMGAHADAIEQAGRARRLAERAGDDQLAARALLALGRSECDVGRIRRARTLLEDARRRFETEGDLRGQAWSMHRLSETWGLAGFDRQLDDLRASYRLFVRAHDRFGRAVVAHDLAYILSVEGGQEFHRWFAQAERLAEDDGDLRSRALLARTWGHYCYSAGRFDEAAETMATCRPMAVEAGERYAEANALVIGALAGVTVGAPADVERLAREAIALGHELGSLRTPALARLALARASIRSGHADQAGRALRAARDAVRSRRVRVMYADVAEAEAMVALDRGSWGRAEVHARALVDALRAIPMGLWDPLPDLIRGRALLGAGRPGDAVLALDDAVRLARAAGADGTLGLARVSRAQAATLAGLPPGRASKRSPGGSEVAAISAETAGIRAFRRGALDEAIDALDRAVASWQVSGSSSWLARAFAIRAEVLGAAGDRARAAASRGRAHAVADEIGMPKKDRSTIDRPIGGIG